jgi:hypothetical protein
MSIPRPVRQISLSKPTLEGAGVALRRAFGFGDPSLFDPFLLLDDFRSTDPARYQRGFPWHPHRGIETITYMLEGEVEHSDSLGNAGVIGPGDVQWMTAGSGIIHQEMPRGNAAGRMGGFQLWANLPAADKMMDPRYRDVTRAQIPVVELPGGVTVKIICGQVGAVRGPVQDIVIDPQYLDVSLPAGASFTHPTPPDHTAFAYVIAGRGAFAAAQASDHALVLFGPGDEVAATAAAEPLRFLLITGRPLREPVAWYGPIVMNTQAELQTAFDEYRNGTFIKVGKA